MKLTEVMDAIGGPYELVFVDDGSKDDSFKVPSEIYEHDGVSNLVRLRRNFGQTPALKAGFDFCAGRSHHFHGRRPAARPRRDSAFSRKIEEGYDLVSGWRHNRRDHWLMRQLPAAPPTG